MYNKIFLKILLFNEDDIGFNYGDCENPFEESITCDFEEEHLCGYISDSKANFNWKRQKSSSSNSNTKPLVDFTTGTSEGYYMYLDNKYPQSKGISRFVALI
mgnify:CR=1 FL=1